MIRDDGELDIELTECRSSSFDERLVARGVLALVTFAGDPTARLEWRHQAARLRSRHSRRSLLITLVEAWREWAERHAVVADERPAEFDDDASADELDCRQGASSVAGLSLALYGETTCARPPWVDDQTVPPRCRWDVDSYLEPYGDARQRKEASERWRRRWRRRLAMVGGAAMAAERRESSHPLVGRTQTVLPGD